MTHEPPHGPGRVCRWCRPDLYVMLADGPVDHARLWAHAAEWCRASVRAPVPRDRGAYMMEWGESE